MARQDIVAPVDECSSFVHDAMAYILHDIPGTPFGKFSRNGRRNRALTALYVANVLSEHGSCRRSTLVAMTGAALKISPATRMDRYVQDLVDAGLLAQIGDMVAFPESVASGEY